MAMNPELNLPEITRLLLLPTSVRTTSDSDLLVRLTQGLKFFSDQPPHIHIACCQAMKVAYFQQSEVVFHVGDEGDSFCIVLKGCVEVLVPGRKLSRQIREEDFYPSNEDDLVLVATLDAGAAFGELSLLSNQPRAATIKAKTSLALAVLYKEDYDRILRAQHDGQLKGKVRFLRSFPIFTDWTQLALSKLSYFFLELTYKKGEVLFREGEGVREVYFIKAGEFELLKRIRVEGCSARIELPRLRQTEGKPRPVLIKSGREVLGYEEAINGESHQYTCRCLSDACVVWALSRDECVKRCQHPASANYLKIRSELQKVFLRSRLSELQRAESLLKTFDGSSLSVVFTESASPEKRFGSAMKVRKCEEARAKSVDPYENVLLAPHEVIASRFLAHFGGTQRVDWTSKPARILLRKPKTYKHA